MRVSGGGLGVALSFFLEGLLSNIIVIYYYIPGGSLTVNFFLLFMAYLKDSKTSQLTLNLFAVLFIIVYF